MRCAEGYMDVLLIAPKRRSFQTTSRWVYEKF